VDEPLYVRIRGRVQGPLDEEGLRRLIKRGQLAQFHEVSTDGVTWKKAGEFIPEFFVNPRGGEGPHTPGGGEDPLPEDEIAGPDDDQWYYGLGDKQLGPETFTHLVELVRSGTLTDEDLVWKEGMPDWVNVSEVPDLRPFLKRAEETPEPTPGGVTSDLIRTLGDSRPWIMFIAITGFIYMVALIAAGFVLIITGAKAEEYTVVASGLTSFLYAGVIATGSMYLLSYHARVGKWLHQNDPSLLETAMRTLRGFCIFVSIVLIVVLVNTVVVAIWAFSVGLLSV